MAVLKNDYEISLWENLTSDQKSYVLLTAEPLDWNSSSTTYYKKNSNGTFSAVAVNSQGKRPTWAASTYYDCAPRLVERKIGIIGSDTMTSPSRALEPCLKQDINGTSTFTFKMYYHYTDPQTGVELENLWVPMLVNEAYIKVKWKNIWHDFVVKNRVEDSSGKSVTFTCEDLFITELSKTGFNLEFDTELENNQGTAFDLAKKALTRSGWTLVYPGWNNGTYPTIDGKLFAPEYIKQYIEEPVYELNGAHVRKSISAKVAEDTTKKVTIPAGARVLLFYSCLQDKPTKIQVVYNNNATTYPTDTNSILVRKDDVQRLTFTGKWSTGKRTINGKEYNCNIFTIGTDEKLWIPTSKAVSGNYRAERLVDCEISTYDAKAKKYVTVYQDSKNDNKKTYGFIGTEYDSSSIVTNLATWSDSGVEGWTGTNLYWTLYPEFTSKTNISSYNSTGYFRISPNGYNYTNNGIYSHSGFLPDGIRSGQKYMIRFRCMSGNANNPTKEITTKLSDVNNIITMSPSAYFSINKSKDHKVVKHGKEYWQEYIFTCTKSILPKNLDTAKILIKRNKKDASGNNITSYLWITDLECFPVIYDKNNTIIYPGEYDKEARAQLQYYYYYPNSSAKSLADITMVATSETPLSRFKPTYDEHNQKIRSISVKQSNVFNILQTIAETFECWVRFGIKHDENGRIQYTSGGAPKKYITFTETIGEDKGYGFVYGIDLKTIQRTVQSNQLVTKTIVQPNSNEFGEEGFCTIARAKDNISKSNFILNFDYFIANGLIDGTQLSNDLYTKTGDNIGYITRLKEINKLYDSSLKKYQKKNNSLLSQESLLDTYKNMVSSTQDEFNATIQDIIYFAEGKTTLSGADSYFKKNGYTKEVQALINDKSKLEKSLNTYKDKVSKLKDSIKALKTEISTIEKQNKLYIKQIDDLDKAFNQKYSRYIQEGSWISEDYMDDNLYYLDGLGVAYTASRPQVQYNISVLRLTALEEFKNKVFDVGDVGYIIDREFFGYQKDGITPVKEQIVVSSISEYFDSPEKDTIAIQNYKTQFEDLFQRITSSTQALQFAQGSYAKVAATINNDKTIDPSVLQASLQQNISIATNPSNEGVLIDSSGLSVINVHNSNERVKITAAGITFTTDGIHWTNTMDANGISINNLKSNSINTNELTIGPADTPSFKWNSEGLNAYKVTTADQATPQGRALLRAANTSTQNLVDRSQFVRFDQYGIYGIEDGENFLSKEYYKPAATHILVNSEPGNWGTKYNDYFIKVGNSYQHVSGINPTFEQDTYYKYDFANNNYILLTEEPADWEDKYTDYFIWTGEYTELGDYLRIAPNFEPGIYYEYEDNEYIPLTEEPEVAGESVWGTEWKNYYYKEVNYNHINTPVPEWANGGVYNYNIFDEDGNQVEEQPDDWNNTWINYFAQINEEYLQVPQFSYDENITYYEYEDNEYIPLESRPEDWETTYYNYYTKEPDTYISLRSEVDFIPNTYYALLDDGVYQLTTDVSRQEDKIYYIYDESINNYIEYYGVYLQTTDVSRQEGVIYYIFDEELNNYVEYDDDLIEGEIYYIFDLDNPMAIGCYELNTNQSYIVLTEKPVDWNTNYTSYFRYVDNEYIPITYIDFVSGKYYQPNYVITNDTVRQDGTTYYTRTINYEIVEDRIRQSGITYYIKDDGTYIEFSGEDFVEGVDYYIKVETNEYIEYEGDLYQGDSSDGHDKYYVNNGWTLLNEQPNDWETNFDSYYFKQEDVYNQIDPILFAYNTYYDGEHNLIEEDPGDFYETYFTYYTHIEGDYVPIWAVNEYIPYSFAIDTYYDYDDETGIYTLLIEEPEDWKENYCYYYTATDNYLSLIEPDLDFQLDTYYEEDSGDYVLLTEAPQDWNQRIALETPNYKGWTQYYIKIDSYSNVESEVPSFGSVGVVYKKQNPTWTANTYYVVENGEYKIADKIDALEQPHQPDDWDDFDSKIYYTKESLEGLNLIKSYARFGLTWDGFFIKNKYGWGYVAIDSEDDFVVVDTRGEESINRVKIGKLGDETDNLFGIEIRDGEGEKVLVTDSNGNLWLQNILTVGDGTRSTVTIGYDINKFHSVILDEQPDDWETNYTRYYIYDEQNEEYIKLEEGDDHTWRTDYYYDLPHGVFHAGENGEGEQSYNSFDVYEDGYMVASGGTFKGEIYATGGKIGGLSIESLASDLENFARFSITSKNIQASVDKANMIFDGDGLKIYDGNFTLVSSNYVPIVATANGSSLISDSYYIRTTDGTKKEGKTYYIYDNNAFEEFTGEEFEEGTTYYEINERDSAIIYFIYIQYTPTDDQQRQEGKTYYVYDETTQTYIQYDGEFVSGVTYYELIDEYRVYTDDFISGHTYYVKEPKETLLQYDEAAESLFVKGNGEFTGTIYATNGSFSGNVAAKSGSIGGFTIREDALTSDSVIYMPWDTEFILTEDAERQEGKIYYTYNSSLHKYQVYSGSLSTNIYENDGWSSTYNNLYIKDGNEYILNNTLEYDEDIIYYEQSPAIQLLGKEGHIVAASIELGTGAGISSYIKLGNAYLYNPEVNDNKFIEIFDDDDNSIVRLTDRGTGFIGKIEFDGRNSMLWAPSWSLTEDKASFINADIAGTIHTSVFEIGKVQVVGGSMIFREGSQVVYIEEDETFTSDEKCRFIITLKSTIKLEANDIVLCTTNSGFGGADIEGEGQGNLDFIQQQSSYYGTIISNDTSNEQQIVIVEFNSSDLNTVYFKTSDESPQTGKTYYTYDEEEDEYIVFTGENFESGVNYFEVRIDKDELNSINQLISLGNITDFDESHFEDDGYVLLTSEPSDWEANYNNYYYENLSQEYENVSLIVPVWASNTYYSFDEDYGYVLLETKPEDWDDNYDTYFIETSSGVFNHVTLIIPAWEQNTYYKKGTDNINDEFFVYDDIKKEYIQSSIFKETTDLTPQPGTTYYYFDTSLDKQKYVKFTGQSFESGIIYYIIDDSKDYFTIDNDLIIGVNSTSGQNKMLFPEGFTFTTLRRGVTNNPYKLPVLFLGNLDNLSQVDSNIHGYGLYGENVFLTGSLTTKLENNIDSKYAGVNTLTGANATVFKAPYFPDPEDQDNSKIVFWAGSKSTSTDDIQQAPFQVTENGSFYANHGLFTGSIFVDATIEAATLRTAAIYGTGDNPALKIFDTNLNKLGIHFYEIDNGAEVETLRLTSAGFSSNQGNSYFVQFDNNEVIFNVDSINSKVFRTISDDNVPYFELINTNLNIVINNDTTVTSYDFIKTSINENSVTYTIKTDNNNYIVQNNKNLNIVTSETIISDNLTLGNNIHYKKAESYSENTGSDLTNSEWIFNEQISITDNITYDIEWETIDLFDGQIWSDIAFELNDNGSLLGPRSEGNYYYEGSNQRWWDDSFKHIKLIGGNDINNSDFKTWLENNATRQDVTSQVIGYDLFIY